MAAIPKFKINKKEPWTGKWKVEGHRIYNGTWVLKQIGDRVISTSANSLKVVGKIEGNLFVGNKSHKETRDRFQLKISSDGLSFEGIATDFLGRSGIYLKGRRKE